jgi:valyl-tRNA synthetase
MVKARARSESDPAGRSSAVATAQQGLGVILRLLAPYLPYVTEEVWSWGFAQATGTSSIHRAPWPSPGELAGGGAGGGDVFDAACGFLDAVRRAKSGAGATVGRQLARLRVATSPRTAALLAPCLADLASAARAGGDILSPREGMEDGAFEVTDIELADKPPKPADA